LIYASLGLTPEGRRIKSFTFLDKGEPIERWREEAASLRWGR